MPSFDIVSKIDMQEVDNAFNQSKREMETRYDFRGTFWEADLNKNDKLINLTADSDMRLKAMVDIISGKMVKRDIDLKALEIKDPKSVAGGNVGQEIGLRDGLGKEEAKKLTKEIKAQKFKVNAQIMDDQVRVTGKKRDDLQNVIQHFKSSNPLDLPLQYINFREK